MTPAASFSKRWASANLVRLPTHKIKPETFSTSDQRMTPAASFSKRWASANLVRLPTLEELDILDLILVTSNGDEEEATKRARRYYTARGPGGFGQLWHNRVPDDEDILSSCQDVLIAPLKIRSVGGRRITIVQLPAPGASNRPISARALLARWLMILDIRLRDDPTPAEEVVFIDVGELLPGHIKNHFKGTYWKDFVWIIKNVYPLRFTEVHIVNTHRLKTMLLMLLQISIYPWRCKTLRVHSHGGDVNDVMGEDSFPEHGLPYDYGGKAGTMKDLNDEWTKRLLSNSKWLLTEERKFYETELKPEVRHRTRHKSSVRLSGQASYNMLTRTHSCRSLHKHDDLDNGLYGAYRTLKVNVDHDIKN